MITERVRDTVVSVDGVHDFGELPAGTHSRVDPSAYLLHEAAAWWRAQHGGCRWVNDGPVPTPGLRAYKARYGGFLLPILKLTPC